MTTHRFLILDVFTDVPLSGNQLAVFTNASGLAEKQMLALAREIGFSETVFVLPSEGDGDVRLRIFTPERELPFAGHPVLGAAFALAAPLQKTVVRLETGAGLVPVVMEREGARLIFGTMVQPTPSFCAWTSPEALLAALGVDGSELPVEVYDNGIRHVFVTLASAEAVAAVGPNFAALARIAPEVGVNVSSWDGSRAKTRMFWPEAGVVEDAATGSAAGPLAVHLCRHGLAEWGAEIAISQGGEIGRPSTLYARAHGQNGVLEAVEVGGVAKVVAKGEFQL